MAPPSTSTAKACNTGIAACAVSSYADHVGTLLPTEIISVILVNMCKYRSSDITVFILFSSALLCSVEPCYVMLCYVMLCYVMLCYVMLCYVMLCYVMLCYVMLCYVMLCYVMLCYVMLCYVMLCYVMLCYVMSCYVIIDCYITLTFLAKLTSDYSCLQGKLVLHIYEE